MLSDHPNPEELRVFLSDTTRLGGTDASSRIVRHLLAGCGTCRRQLEAMGWRGSRLDRLLYLRARSGESSFDQSSANSYDQAFAVAERALAAAFAQGRPADTPAEVLAGELEPLSWQEQIRRVEGDRRLASPELVKLWIEGSQAARYQAPERTLHLAHLASLAAESCSSEETGSPEKLADLRTESWRQYGNALRLQGRIREAEAAFARAQRYCDDGTRDPLVRARLLAQVASLRIVQQRFAEAAELSDEAGRIHGEIGRTSSLASNLVQKAVALLYAGEAEEAVHVLNRAIPRIGPDGDPHLLLAACHNLIRCYIDLDRPEQALSLYFEARDLYREFDDALILLRTTWQEGQLLRDLGHLQAAEAALIHTREGFGSRGLLLPAAQISLDLASVYVQMGDTEKLQQTVAETVPIFRALGVGRDALASLLQLQQLAEQGRQAFELIRMLSAQIEQLGRGRAS